MTRIELTEKEAAILIEILESFLSDLQTERVHTDNKELHAVFVEREMFVDDLMKRLGKK
jgi:hypothetical protein